jgi:L-2,4-diaminobutyrate decarboxylase
MLLPGLVTAVLFRDGRSSYRTFAQRASYLYDEGAAENRWADVGLRTLECTKRMMSIQLYAALELLGPEFFGAVVDRTWALGQELASRIREAPDLELAVEPEANIVCFRHRPDDVRDLDAHQLRLRDSVDRRGRVFVASTELDGAQWLRTTLINPLTEARDLDRLLAELREVAAQGEPSDQPQAGGELSTG